MAALFRQTNRRLSALLPLFSSIALVLVSITPLGLPHLNSIAPLLAVMAVFYWSIFRADLMSMLDAFLIGLLLDLLGGGPPGLNAATLLLIHQLGVSQRRVFLGSSFLVNWTAFALVAGAVLPISWLVVSLLHWSLLPTAPVLAQFLLSLAIYPAVYWMFSRLERRLPRPEEPF